MQVFVRVAETGGITRAADSLQMPKATATTLIQQLEGALGVKLLNRTTRKVSVTADGAAYYPRCVAILDEIRETEESLAHRHASPQGRLRVEVPTLIARLVIVPALPAFFAQYPEIELRSRSEPAGDTGSKAPHVVLDQLQGFGGEGACGAADEGLFRDHIIGVAGVDLGNAEDRRVERPHIARDDCLQSRRDVACDNDRIDADLGAAPCAPRPVTVMSK